MLLCCVFVVLCVVVVLLCCVGVLRLVCSVGGERYCSGVSVFVCMLMWLRVCLCVCCVLFC